MRKLIWSMHFDTENTILLFVFHVILRHGSLFKCCVCALPWYWGRDNHESSLNNGITLYFKVPPQRQGHYIHVHLIWAVIVMATCTVCSTHQKIPADNLHFSEIAEVDLSFFSNDTHTRARTRTHARTHTEKLTRSPITGDTSCSEYTNRHSCSPRLHVVAIS